MAKTVFITGSTDGIGLAAARALAPAGHTVLLHGRNETKLEQAKAELSAMPGAGAVEGYVADLSNLAEVESLASAVTAKHQALDALINNAGVFKTTHPSTADGMDVRFVVNTIAPYLLTRRLLPLLGPSSRVINLSSAAQSTVDPRAVGGPVQLPDMEAYAQSKLALTMWSRTMAHSLAESGPAVIAVNPGSLLATKMVKEGFGMAGSDISKGADILVRLALSDEFADASGLYFDNDKGRLAPPHPDGLDDGKSSAVVEAIEAVLARAA